MANEGRMELYKPNIVDCQCDGDRGYFPERNLTRTNRSTLREIQNLQTNAFREICNATRLVMSVDEIHKIPQTVEQLWYARSPIGLSQNYVDYHEFNGVPSPRELSLCRAFSENFHKTRRLELPFNRPKRSVSWAEDLVEVVEYEQPRPKYWAALRKKLRQVMTAIREDIEF